MRYLQSLFAIAAFLAMPLSYASTQDLDETDFSSTAASVFKVDENNNYADNLALREARKIGLGLGLGGSLGFYGFNIEINFEDADGAMAGVGGGDGYSSFNLLWKHTFLGDTVAPYTTLGYSRWYNASGGGNYKNSAVLDRVLTDQEKADGKFATDFLSGSVGLQYTTLRGELAGTSLFAEFVLLGDVHHGNIVPTGTVGAGYYF
ncbi:MAG: hypothetical protein JSU04_01660 [Bdellovibrionales bacterium]|nr:hypothetical protein [Bdellovibrionales bacterium]